MDSKVWSIIEYNQWIRDECPLNENVLELDVSFSKLSSLVNLQNLVNLEYLNCVGNHLTDLNDIQNLTNLQILNCSMNQLITLNGIQNLTNLQQLYCYNNKLTTINGIQNLTNLTHLYCTNNNLTNLNDIQNLVNLQKLYCSKNHLTALNYIENLVNLEELHYHNNNITTLNYIQNLVKLKKLNFSNNNITTLNGIQNLINLQILNCTNNNLTNLNNIQNLTNLQKLYCNHNNLTTLNGIQNLVNLQYLNCSFNNLTTLNDIQYLIRLEECYYSNNPIEHIPPNILRRLNQIHNGQNIYGDSQNVHNHHIQESIRQSIFNILQTKPTITNTNELIINDPILSEQTKRLLFEYSTCKDVHSCLNITFEELLLYVFDRIEQNEHKDEIKRVLNIEIDESVCKCFTGRISRLINCLNGFDPLVSINISDSEQISQIIILIRNELNQTNSYSTSVHKQLVRNRLKELMYPNDVIELWIENIE
jgi:Leucine-rich repeat (LRR) protein